VRYVNYRWQSIQLLLIEFYHFNHNTANSNTFTTTYCAGFILWHTVICAFYCAICKHLGPHSVHTYWMYLQYDLRIGLMVAGWDKTRCHIYRLTTKLSVVFRLNIIIFVWYFYQKKISFRRNSNMEKTRALISCEKECQGHHA